MLIYMLCCFIILPHYISEGYIAAESNTVYDMPKKDMSKYSITKV